MLIKCKDGTDSLSQWDYNINIPPEIAEIEAESVACLVSMLQGPESNSERRLSNFRIPADIHLPSFGLNGVLRATDYIEKIGERKRDPAFYVQFFEAEIK